MLPDDLAQVRYRDCAKAVGAAEAFADGHVTKKELTATRVAARGRARAEDGALWRKWAALACLGSVEESAGRAAADAAENAAFVAALGNAPQGSHEEVCARQAALLRDIFGNPFRRATAEPGWLTSTAVALARAIYAERAFDRLPILAVALEEAGCDNAELLTHCRGDGPHVRGCWAVDLTLGQE